MKVEILIRPILPEPNVMGRKLQRIKDELVETTSGPIARMLIRGFLKRTAFWDDPPTFQGVTREQVRQIRLDVGPFGRNKRKWVFVSGGTTRHLISPRRKNYLYIKRGYNPHTKTGDYYRGPGTYDGPFYRTIRGVLHPGNAPREFEKYIIQDTKDSILRLVRAAIARATA